MGELDAGRLQTFLDGRWAGIRDEVRAQLRDPRFHPAIGLSTDEHRARVTGQAGVLAALTGPQLGFPARYGGGGDVGAFVTAFETLAFGDLSLLVKVGVQWGL